MRSTLVRCRLLALFLAACIAGLVAYLAPGWQMWATPLRLLVTGVLATGLALALATLWRGSSGRRLVGAGLLFAGVALIGLDVAGIHVSSASPGPVPYELLIVVAMGLAGIGVLARRRAARWLALGLSAAGAVSSGLNLHTWMSAGIVDEFGWTLAVWTMGGLAILATLTGRDVAACDRLAAREEVWRSRDPLVFWTRAATITAIVASPMLLVYAFMQEGAVAALSAPAAALAVLLAIAAALAGHGKALGGVLLAVGGLALVGMLIAVFALRPDGEGMRIPAFYLPFWLPAALTGLASGAALGLAARRVRSPAGP